MNRKLRDLLHLGPLPKGVQVQVIHDSSDLESLEIGDVIAPFNDYYLAWDEACVPPSKLEPWRHEGDPLCDEVVRALNLKPGQDGLQRLIDGLQDPNADPCLGRFWKEIAGAPPEGVSAFDNLYAATPAIYTPNRRPAASVSEGQAVFWRYSSQIFSALLHYSLAGGFSANRVVGVLRETSYLTGDVRDKTYKRLLETTQAIIDYMNDLEPLTGRGWKSAIRVRMLHSTVRVRLAAKQGLLNTYDEKVDGLPINQEDLLATLGSFAVAPLWTLTRQGIHLSPEEEMAYIAVWRHVGYYLGVSPDRLRRYYSTVDDAMKIFACHTMHLFSSDAVTTDFKASSTYRLLASVANRPPRNLPVEHSLAVSRFMLGDGFADILAIPRTTFVRNVRMQFGMFMEWALVYFGRCWTTRWEVERVAMTRKVIQMIVVWQLGGRRTKFTSKVFSVTAEKDDGTEDDDDLDPEVTTGPEAGKAIVRRWKWLLGEMAAVLVVPVMLASGIVAYTTLR